MISLLAHGGAFWLIARLPPLQQRSAIARATEMTIISGFATTPAPVVVASLQRPRASLRNREEPRAPSQPQASAVAPAEAAPPNAADRPVPPEALRGVALFPQAVIEQMAKVDRPSFGGTLRRRGDGWPPPDAPSRSHEGDEETALRVQKLVDGAAGVATVESGRVDPAWRDAERQIDGAFRPSAELVSRDSTGQLLLRQLGEGERQSRPSVRADPVSGSAGGAIDRWNGAADEAAEAHRRANRQGQWTEAEIETVVDERGEVVSAVVVSRSGNRAFDQAALAAVRRGLSRRRVRDPRGKMVARWLVQAGVSTFIPPGTVLLDKQGRTLPGATLFSLTFDETTGKIGLRHPLQKSVSTRVQLRALAPQP
jgi:Gram-negative bacterial TonB protein C-terminal